MEKTKHNVRNFDFDSIVGKHAKEQFRLWHFSKEWRVGIIILTILKVVTWIISIYAGFYFLFKIILPVVESSTIAKISAILLLIMTELLTWFFLSKFFKFIYKSIYATATFAGVIAIAIYSLSFYMTTNGLAMRQADKVDKTELIVDNTALEIEEIKESINSRIEDYRKEIETIKSNPQGWKNGKLDRLTAKQLSDIKSMNIIIDSLERTKKAEISNIQTSKESQLSTNLVQTTAEADKYHRYVIIVMIAQFIFNGLLMFSWSRIYNENDRLQVVNEDIAKAENDIIGNFFSHIAERLFQESSNIMRSIDNQKAIPFEIVDNTNHPSIAGFSNSSNQKADSSKSSNIGFKQHNKTQFEQGSNTKKETENKQVDKSNILGKLRTNDMLRYCIKKKSDGIVDLTEKEIRNQCDVKRWKYFEFQNLMISAGLINEPIKYRNNEKN